MARPRVKLNSAGIRAILGDPSGHLRGLAERVLAAAQANAPVESGEYRASLHVEQVTTDRAVARVVANAPHALAVEARTGNLARALDAAGGG